jgi:putative NADH-flavin reductase
MKVLVIGATGGTGRHVVNKLLDQGHEVTAWVRNPAAVEITHDRMRIAQGEARDPASIDRAVLGQDAVVVAFGPRSLKKDNVQEVLFKNLTEAMTRHGVKRIINLSAWGLNNPKAMRSTVFFEYFFRPLFLRHVWADKERAESILKSSGLDYINIQPGRLLDSPPRAASKPHSTARASNHE